MANVPLSKDVPHIYVPSFSVPHLKTPQLYVPHLNVPGKGRFPNIERRHVKDLGDVILGNPITGTKQLRETLIDNDAAYLINNPIMNRIAGLHYLAKERFFDPFTERSLPEAAMVSFINTVESIGYSMDTLANPVKSLMPWTGGGKGGDFLRSMGWLDNEYRENFEWNTGNFVVDLAGEILSDPTNIASTGSKLILKATDVYDELSMTIRNTIRNRWGDVVANHVPDSVIAEMIKVLEEDVSKQKSDIIEKFGTWLEREHDKNTLIVAMSPSSADAVKFDTEVLSQYRRALDFKQQDDFLQELLDIRLSPSYRYYRAIRNVGETADMIDNQLLHLSLGINPIIGANMLLYKKFSPLIKQKWNNILTTKNTFDLDNRFKNTPADVKRLQRTVTLKNKNKYKRVVSKARAIFEQEDLDLGKLTDVYLEIMESIPRSSRTKSNVDKAFIKWLRENVPGLKYIANLMQDPAIKRILKDIKVDIPDEEFLEALKEADVNIELLKEENAKRIKETTWAEENMPELVEVQKEDLLKVKALHDLSNAVADNALQMKAIEQAGVDIARGWLQKQVVQYFESKEGVETVRNYIDNLYKELKDEDARLYKDIKSKLKKYKKKLWLNNIDKIREKVAKDLDKLLGISEDTGTLIIDGANEISAIDWRSAVIEKNLKEEIERRTKIYNEYKEALLEEKRKAIQARRIDIELEEDELIRIYGSEDEIIRKTDKGFNIEEQLEYIDQELLKIGDRRYGLKYVKNYLDTIKEQDPDQYLRVKYVLRLVGIDPEQNETRMIALYNKYKQGKPAGLKNDMKKLLDEILADSSDTNDLNALKASKDVITTISPERDYEDDPVVVYLKNKVDMLEKSAPKIQKDIQREILQVFENYGFDVDLESNELYKGVYNFFRALDEMFPYDGGDTYADEMHSWLGSFKNLITDDLKDPKQFYDNLNNFLDNVNRLYWKLRNNKENRELLDTLESWSKYKNTTGYIPKEGFRIPNSIYSGETINELIDTNGFEEMKWVKEKNGYSTKIKKDTIWVPTHDDNPLAQQNVSNIINDLHEVLTEVNDTVMPQIIDSVLANEDMYYLMLTHKGNYNLLKIKLNTFFDVTNPKAWKEYLNPDSPTRLNLENVCLILMRYAGDDSEVVKEFAKDLNKVLTALDATTALNKLIDTIPNMTSYNLSKRVKNLLIDRIYNALESLRGESIHTVTSGDVVSKIIDELVRYEDYLDFNITDDLIDSNPTNEYVAEYLKRAVETEDPAYAQDVWLDFMNEFRTNFINAFDIYKENIQNLHNKNDLITLGYIFTSKDIAYMSMLGAFESEVIKILSDTKTLEDVDITLTTDFIHNVTGRYTDDEAEQVKENCMRIINETITEDEEKEGLILEIRNLDNTLARVITDSWNDIARMNNKLQNAVGYSGKIRTEDGVVRMKNILGYISRSELDQVIQDSLTERNIVYWAITSGYIGVKKAIDSHFAGVHKILPDLFGFKAGVNDNVYVNFYHNFRQYYRYVTNYFDTSKKQIEKIRNNLIKFALQVNGYDIEPIQLDLFDEFTTNKVTRLGEQYGGVKNKINNVAWLPKDPINYFTNLSDRDILTWDQFIKSGIMEQRTKQGYPLAKKYRTITKEPEPKVEKFVPINKKTAEEQQQALRTAHVDNTTHLTLYCEAYRKLLTGVALEDADWDALIKGTPADHLDILTDVFTTEVTKFAKDINTLQAHKGDFENYHTRNLKAYHNLDPIIALTKDNRMLREVGWNNLSKATKKHLTEIGIHSRTRVNSDEFQKFLKLERARNIAMSIRNATAKELRGYIDTYTEGTLFYVSDGTRFKWTKADLEEAGVIIDVLPDSNIYVIRRTDNISRGYKFKWRIAKPIFPELQQIYTDAIMANRNYFNLVDMDAPFEILTGEMVETHEYRAVMASKPVQKIAGSDAEQKVYSKLSKNGRNNFYYGDYSRVNLVFVGDNANAYNAVLDYSMPYLVDQGIEPAFKNNRLDTTMYYGSVTALRNTDKKTKWLQLFFNDDFYLGNPMFKQAFKDATDEEIKTFFDRNNWVACVLKEDRHGNPRVYKIYVENRKQLQDAMKGKAIVVPYDTYSVMLGAINDSLIEDKIFQAYTKYVVGTYKTIYLTSLGFLMRNGFDSLIYKNMNSTEGLPGMLDTFRYDYEARRMLKEHNDVIKKVLTMGDNQFKTKNLREVLSTLSPDKQLEFRLTDRFLSSKASSGLAEEMEQYYRSKELREGIVSGNKSFWDSFNADIIHGKYSPITIINNANSTIEQTARYGLFLNLVHNGVDSTSAIKRVIDTHFNYDIKGTPMEIVEQLFWFTTFPINNFNYYIKDGLTRNPLLLKAQLDAMELSYNNGDITWDDVRESNYLRYNASVGNIVIRSNGKSIVVKLGSSVFDFFNLLFNPIGQTVERLNPFLATALGLEDATELNPLRTPYNRTKQFFQGKSLIPSIYNPLYERTQYNRLPNIAKAPTYYRKSKWRPKYKKSYFKNPDNMKRMMYKFTTYRYYFGRGKNYRRWLQSSTSIEPYWYNQNYKRLRSSRARKYKQQIKKI